MRIFKNNKIPSVRCAENVGSFLKSIRVDKGLTQQELADILNISPKTISKWENNNGFPDILLQVPLCDVLGITLEELHNGKLNIEKRTKEKKENFHKIALVSLIIMLVITNIIFYFRINYYKYHYNPLSLYYVDVTDDKQTICNIDGYYIKDRNVNILYIGNIKPLTDDYNDTDITEVNFIYNDEIIFTSSDIKNISINLEDNINPKDISVQIIIRDYTTSHEKFNQTFRIDLTAKEINDSFEYEQNDKLFIKKLLDMGFEKVNNNTYMKIDKDQKVSYDSITQTIVINTLGSDNVFIINYNFSTRELKVSLLSNIRNNMVMIEKYSYNMYIKEITNDIGHGYSLDKALKIIEPYITLHKRYLVSTN